MEQFVIPEAADRIRQMERYYDILQKTVDENPTAIQEDVLLKDYLQILTQYYESGQWLQDYELDENGLLPRNLKRGVLAQDTLYNFFDRVKNATLIELEQQSKGRVQMRNYEIEKEMYRKAVELIERRYPAGWGGAGVVHTANGNYYTSVSIETANASAIVCIETGAMLEAHKYNEKVTHCMCLIRDDEKSEFRVLSPCGICQERLRYWGDDVQVAVTTEEKEIKFVELKELQPYHWTNAYPKEELEHWEGTV